MFLSLKPPKILQVGKMVYFGRVAEKWQNRKLRLLLRGPMLAEELCAATDEIQGSLCKLHLVLLNLQSERLVYIRHVT